MFVDISKEKLSEGMKKHFLSHVDKLYEFMAKAETLSPGEINSLTTLLNQMLPLLPTDSSITSGFSLPFERLSINERIIGANNRLKHIADVRYPPRTIAHQLGYNRASLKGQTHMYAGSMGTLCNSIEIQPEMGQLTTVSKWKMKEGKKLKLLVICQDGDLALSNPNELLKDYNKYTSWLDQLDDNTADVIDGMYKFIARAFAREVSPSNRQGYIVSALISDFLFSKTGTEALYYASVPNRGAEMNIVIKPDIVDDVFELVEVQESLCSSRIPNSNQWMFEVTGSSKDFDKEGKINWTNAIMPEGGTAHKLIEYYNIKLD